MMYKSLNPSSVWLYRLQLLVLCAIIQVSTNHAFVGHLQGIPVPTTRPIRQKPTPFLPVTAQCPQLRRQHRPNSFFYYCRHATTTDSNNEKDDTTTTTTTLTDWVVENLETDNQVITTASTIRAGENDTLPTEGLAIGDFLILAAEQAPHHTFGKLQPIRLLLGRNGWGTGVHPTTRLCLEWLSSSSIKGGEVILDYGCGSGILSIAALHQGASRVVGVDVEAEALVTTERNLQLNGYGAERFQGLHTRQVEPYGMVPAADICVANIMVGQLVRPSMVAALVSNLAPGGWLCLSGIRPHQVDALKQAYGESIEWEHSAELSASECEGSLESYGFDTGRWARLAGRRKRNDREEDIQSMSELAVS
ncbi:protein L11 methyltransferase [Seminavis robusta]|uniref:ETFB lysine methyltransferase n=1 Tax=Seminavis robusta TaxID=568900 RepID=A0A9N8HMZ4_9STRA|nr:protein L11 methyltransferase [Seminavis robusta]|eukprot:Sro944_g222950.1 protein L11 methyltransferase (364) ;mRNA; f:19930-21021